MVSFQIKLAEISMRIHSIYRSTMQFCSEYLTDETPKFEIEITQKDIDEERIHSVHSSVQEGREVVHYTDAYLETLALYRKITAKLIDFHVLLFHSSAVAVGGQVYLFTAKSGVGKTTHTKLWLRNIPNCHVLNGDKPLLLFRNDGIYVCGTPWQGKENYGTNEILPLKALCVLERGKQNHIKQISFGVAFATLMMQAHHPDAGAGVIQSIQLLKQFDRIKLYQLQCNMQDEAAFVSYKGMVENYDKQKIL